LKGIRVLNSNGQNIQIIQQSDAARPRDPRFLRFYARAFFTHDFKNRSAENIFRSGALRRFLKIGARTANDELARRVDLAPESARREAAR
jgi:hypothetical protein